MSAKNRPVSKPMNTKFSSGYDAIFGKGGPRPAISERNAELALASDQALIDELNKRKLAVKYCRKAKECQPEKPKDRVKQGISPSCVIEEIDCRS